MSVVIEAQQVSKCFHLRHNKSNDLKVHFLAMFHERHRETVEEFWALRDVSFAVRAGESVGLIGRNGSGKSTLLKIVAGLYLPTSGRMLVSAERRIGTMIELGVGFHPELNGKENVYLSASVHGLKRAQVDELYPKVVKYSGLEHFMDTPLKNYSIGMKMRLGFGLAINITPSILLLDEIFAVGDAEFQVQCAETLAEFRAQGKTILFVSHSPLAIRALCDRVCVLDHGQIQYDGRVAEGLAFYQNLTARHAAGARV